MSPLDALTLSPFITQIRESAILYPWIQIIHLISLCGFLAPVLVADLIILGLIKRKSLLFPFVKNSAFQYVFLAIAFVSGALLFLTATNRIFHSFWFRWKIIFLFVALANGLYLKWHIAPSIGSRDLSRLKKFAILSLSLWSVILILGKLIAYGWLDCGFATHPILIWFIQCE